MLGSFPSLVGYNDRLSIGQAQSKSPFESSVDGLSQKVAVKGDPECAQNPTKKEACGRMHMGIFSKFGPEQQEWEEPSFTQRGLAQVAPGVDVGGTCQSSRPTKHDIIAAIT